MREITVSLFGKGDFQTIQEAVDSIIEGEGPVTIKILEGVYHTRVCVNKPNVTLIGIGKVVITYGLGAKHRDEYGKELGTFRTETVKIAADGFTAQNIIFENSAGPGNVAGQALALYIKADRVRFRNCSFVGNQDTIYTGSVKESGFTAESNIEHRQYFESCYIDGDVDFIFGGGTVVFKDCEIYSRNRHEEAGKTNGFITAASTGEAARYGYVFINCRLTSAAAENSVYLGRPWRDYANVIFVDCYMGAHIKKEGWHNWGNPAKERTARYGEWGSIGPGSCMDERVAWQKEVPEELRKGYNLSLIFGEKNKWSPNNWD